MQDAPYKIYNASAGSGKTYMLAKEYLKIVLSSDFNKDYRRILAITFTNKAVNEMKQRILGSLFDFGKKEGNKIPPMLMDISAELGVSVPILQSRSKQALKEILHNYAFFDVSTIDKFTHRLIRTFAKDLKLPQNFEVVLDTDLLLDEAVAKLINKAGSNNKKLTKVLVDFAMEKIDEDKSWDIAIDLHKIGKLLFNENQIPHLKKLEGKDIDDFLTLKNSITQNIKLVETQIKENADRILEIIHENGLEFGNFKSAYFPKFISKIAEGDLNIDFVAGWKQNFSSEPLYTKTCPQAIKDILDGLHPLFNTHFQQIKEQATHISLLRNAYSNIVPLTVLSAIQQELKALELERDLLPISSFNRLISNEIKDQPAPFIYERLGEKYRHYFIDEFQDTSQMQWNNLTPLVGNALESMDSFGKTGSLLLVGDAKQAIYRWRGGKAEQFLDLIDQMENPFVTPPTTENLPANYRSHEEIIKFNNDFFTLTTPFLQNSTYRKLFLEGNQQRYNSKNGGFVQLEFIEVDDSQKEDEVYCNAVFNMLEEVRDKNYSLKDICILTRKKRHGILLADFLMERNISIISSETLLLNSNPKVRFLINLLYLSVRPTDPEIGFEIISYLFGEEKHLHQYIHNHLNAVPSLLREHCGFNLETLKRSSVYDGLEYAIKKFRLAEGSDAYITYLMDVAQEVEQKEGANSQVFLAHWEKKKDQLGVTAPENVDAVQIMTVHKSKGLEFPIVIFPFANTHIYEEMEAKLWLPVPEESFNGFQEILINKKQEVLTYGEVAETLYTEEQHKLELDAFNILYVALTRAVKGLYVVTKKDLTQKGDHKPNYYSGLFIHYLKEKGLWEDSTLKYRFGDLENNSEIMDNKNIREIIPYSYTFKERPEFRILTRSGVLWDTYRESALFKGNVVHLIMGMIKAREDMDDAINGLIRQGELTAEERADIRRKINAIVDHPDLNDYFVKDNEVRNEQEILTKDGRLLRPDRIVIHGNKATIIDYKTGKKNPVYHQQIQLYGDTLEGMGYQIENKILVYINEDITLDFI